MSSTALRPKRRWLRFSLRTLLLVCTLLCAALGFRLAQLAPQREVVRLARESGGWVTYDVGWQPDDLHATLSDLLGQRTPVAIVLYGKRIDNAVVARLAHVASLQEIDLVGVAVTNEGLSPLNRLRHLKHLTCTRDHDNFGLTRMTSVVAFADFTETPLEELLLYLSDTHTVDFVRDPDVAMNLKDPITVSITGQRTLGQGLDEILKPLALGWLIREGNILITSANNSAAARKSRADLEVAFPGVRISVD